MPQHGLIEVYAVGGAGLLVKKHVLEAIGEPYFETYGKQNEDLVSAGRSGTPASKSMWTSTRCWGISGMRLCGRAGTTSTTGGSA